MARRLSALPLIAHSGSECTVSGGMDGLRGGHGVGTAEKDETAADSGVRFASFIGAQT